MADLNIERELAIPVLRPVLMHGAHREGGHQAATHRALSQRLARLLDLPFGGDCAPGHSGYLVPRATLRGRRVARRHALRSEYDLFGGWVVHGWMATKAIVHPLVSPHAVTPYGWVAGLPEQATPLTLSGFTAFSPADAHEAGMRLLRAGPVRIKPVSADGGRSQLVARNEDELVQAIGALSLGGELADVVTLEEDLAEVETYSVGQVRLPDRIASYCGTQRLTRNNHGGLAYGGSQLLVVDGGFERLLRLPLPDTMREATLRAVAFDALADRHLPGFIASRRNYDVAVGLGADGRRRIGVLEQSWRIGGASGAEIIALERMARDPSVRAVTARTVETYGVTTEFPDDALVYFHGHDPEVGPLIKYACVDTTIEG